MWPVNKDIIYSVWQIYNHVCNYVYYYLFIFSIYLASLIHNEDLHSRFPIFSIAFIRPTNVYVLSDFKFFLQCVRHAGSSSTTTMLTCGVPQGSVLGPILFLLYTADLLTIITNHVLQGHLYSYYSQVYGFCRPNSTDVQHLRSVSTSCINDIADWMNCNRLQLNSSKSEFIWCSSSRRLKYLDCQPFF